ncbi:MAG: hypothetical protein ACKVS5_14635 [Parvularculaceae bacterium]
MIIRFLISAAAFAMAIFSGAFAQPTGLRPYGEIMKDAEAAFAAEDYGLAAARIEEALAQRPYSLFLTRNLVLANLLAGEIAPAIAIVTDIADRGLYLEFPAHEAFERLRAEEAFKPVADRFQANARSVGTPLVVAEFTETGLLPEAIAKYGDGILIGSVRTGAIYAVRDGALRKLATLDGGVFDIETLGSATFAYAVINNQLAYENAGERPPEAAIVKVDLLSGEILWRRPIEAGNALLGDIELKPLRIYSSDSITPRLFVQDPDLIPRVLTEDSRFVNLQGLAADEGGRRLFVADYLAGLFVVDVLTRNVTQIENPTGAHLGGIDGLYLHKGDLIGIQNGTTPQRIVRIDLDKKGRVAKSLTVLQQALPEWNEPTHGFVDGDRFVYIATSNWPAYGDDGEPVEGRPLAPLRIMSVDLN